MYGKRRDRLKRRLASLEMSALLVMKPTDLHYLTGFRGGYTGARAVLIVSPRSESVLFTDSRYLEEAKAEVAEVRIGLWSDSGYARIKEELQVRGAQGVGLDGDHINAKSYFRLRSALRGLGVRLAPPVVAEQRVVKETAEIDLMVQAAALGDRTFSHVLGILSPGLTEQEVALEAEFTMRKLGAETAAFEVIVASGVRAAFPHARAGAKRLAAGEIVIIDLGAVVDGYHSDMTRTVVLGKATAKQTKLHQLVRRVQEETISILTAGKKLAEIDRFARERLTAAGHGQHFRHNLGHGVGLAVHEPPVLGPEGRGILEVGTVITVEPGVYLPGFGGVRIEDMVHIEKDGVRVLTGAPKELIEL